ncbi:hypothetical protein PHPALM_3601 [Phytophthora palmivora]|uniref:Uncharacterized protein n=1 Tax=Phytophthora palmivora TaxID=4796 RepID=A0A2P4YLZ0_9STRA|nr:hypothetical protein PHPALM_3601 [Phytophthora palmivora]
MGGDETGEARKEPAITIATGANMPVPPMYRGSTKKEKKAFMDSYLIYKRRIMTLNQRSYGKGFVMPLIWKSYFLAARRPDVQDHYQLAQAMRSLAMNTSLPDPEPRVMKLVTDFNEI